MTNSIMCLECETLLKLVSTHEAASLLGYRFEIDPIRWLLITSKMEMLMRESDEKRLCV